MVRSNIRRRPDRGNFNIHSHRAMRVNKLLLQLQIKMEEDGMEGVYLSNSQGQNNRLEMLPVLGMGVQEPH